MTIGIWILGDRLDHNHAALQSCQDRKSQTSVILIESLNYLRERWYHKQKLVLIWSAMRHFAAELERDGWQVKYAIADDFLPPLLEWIREREITELRVINPVERPFRSVLKHLDLPCQLEIFPDNHFLWSTEEFEDWTKSRKGLVMEYFYRAGREKFQILMNGDSPIGEWNLDKENRQVLGWREYMHGIYQHVDDEYFHANWFGHDRPLPALFWDASQAKMNCLPLQLFLLGLSRSTPAETTISRQNGTHPQKSRSHLAYRTSHHPSTSN